MPCKIESVGAKLKHRGLQMCLGLDESFSWFANQIRCFLWYTIISCYDRCFLFNRSFSTTSCKLWLRVKIESGGAELERLCVGTDAPVFPVLRAMLRHTTTLGQYLYLYNTEILLWQGIQLISFKYHSRRQPLYDTVRLFRHLWAHKIS